MTRRICSVICRLGVEWSGVTLRLTVKSIRLGTEPYTNRFMH